VLPAACPACGLVLAKFGAAPPRLLGATNIRGPSARLADQAEPQATAADALAEFAALLVHVSERVDAIEVWARSALLAGLAVWGAVLIGQDFRTGELMQSFLHRPLLIFHEAGHVIFGLLGHWLMVPGGSLGQLIMPLALGWGAWLLRQQFKVLRDKA
jgi:hypothetical protein